MIELYAEHKTVRSLPWVYAHGQAEKILKIDMVGVDKESMLDLNTLAEGIYHCAVYNKATDMFEEGLIFFWYPPLGPIKSKGLVVLLSDTDSILYALEKYKTKADKL